MRYHQELRNETISLNSSCIIPAVVWGESITKVAVLDYTRILTAFYADSAEVRKIEEMKSAFADKVRSLQQEIQELEEKKITAQNNEDSLSVLKLDKRILERKQYYQEYVRVRGNQIQQASANLSASHALAQEIRREIKYVAESNGFSIVMKRSDPNLLWWNYETDITDLVLNRLIRNE